MKDQIYTDRVVCLIQCDFATNSFFSFKINDKSKKLLHN